MRKINEFINEKLVISKSIKKNDSYTKEQLKDIVVDILENNKYQVTKLESDEIKDNEVYPSFEIRLKSAPNRQASAIIVFSQSATNLDIKQSYCTQHKINTAKHLHYYYYYVPFIYADKLCLRSAETVFKTMNDDKCSLKELYDQHNNLEFEL